MGSPISRQTVFFFIFFCGNSRGSINRHVCMGCTSARPHSLSIIFHLSPFVLREVHFPPPPLTHTHHSILFRPSRRQFILLFARLPLHNSVFLLLLFSLLSEALKRKTHPFRDCLRPRPRFFSFLHFPCKIMINFLGAKWVPCLHTRLSWH